VKEDMFFTCSGQNYFNPKGPGWGISLRKYNDCPWWRLEDRAGRQRRFRTYESAEKIRLKLEDHFRNIIIDALSPQQYGEAVNHIVREM
jgi:hypothetical protein